MSDKPYFNGGRADKNFALLVRIIVGIALFFALLLMFIVNPGPGDSFSKEYLWMAVHPFNLFWDSLGMIGLIGVCLYVTGLLKPVYSIVAPKAANSTGGILVALGVFVALMFCFYI